MTDIRNDIKLLRKEMAENVETLKKQKARLKQLNELARQTRAIEKNIREEQKKLAEKGPKAIRKRQRAAGPVTVVVENGVAV